MDWSKALELAFVVGTALLATYIKDLVRKVALHHRVSTLEEKLKNQNDEMKDLNDTLNVTNQSLSSLNATVQSLSKWLERVDDRQNSQL